MAVEEKAEDAVLGPGLVLGLLSERLNKASNTQLARSPQRAVLGLLVQAECREPSRTRVLDSSRLTHSHSEAETLWQRVLPLMSHPPAP